MRVDLSAEVGGQEADAANAASRHSSAFVRGETDGPRFEHGEPSWGEIWATAITSPEVRLAKVESLRARIADGSYYVSAGDLAEALLEQMRGTQEEK